MSGYQIGTYNPPSLNMLEKKKEEIHLLDIDFEDVKIEDHKVEYNNSSLLDFSDVDIKKEPIQSPENKLSDVFTTQSNRPKLDDDINANSSLIDNEKKEGDIPNKADLEENKANIVEQPSGYDRYMNFEYYKQFFDITTEEAIIRLRNACVPFFYQGSIFEGKIDLYCPIWVIITLNVTITIFGNMARYIKFETSNDEKQYKSDVKNFTKNVPLITMYAILMPIFLSCLIKLTGSRHISKMTFTMFAIYGYCFTCFIPASILYIIPFNGFKWLVLLVAGLISLFFLSRELYPMAVRNLDESKLKIATGVICVSHFLFILCLKF